MGEEQKNLQKEADSVAKEVEESIEITESDRQLSELSTEEEQIAMDIQRDLETFIQDKVEIDPGLGEIERLPTGIDLLDAILGGGFGLGTFTQIIGNPGTFKSALLGQFIGNCQKKFEGKLLAAFYDSEVAMTTARLANLGVTRPKLKPYDDKVTVEKVFKTIEAFAAFKELRKIDFPGIVAWDSIANTSVEKEFTTDDVNQTIGLKARILAALLPRYVTKLREYKISLIAVNQLREKMDVGQYASANDLRWMGDKVIPGGQAVKFNSFHLLYLKARSDLKKEQYGFNGLLMEAKCIKNKFCKPNQPIDLIVNFDTGISNFWTNYNFLVKQKRLQAGAWNYLKTLPTKKFRTINAEDLYNSNEDGFKSEFDKQVKEAIETEFQTITEDSHVISNRQS